jgi:hypothetical protein
VKQADEKRSGGLRRRAVLALAASAMALAGAAEGRQAGELVDLAVVDRETGEEMRVWRHGGRLFVAGRPGARYGLRVTNHSAGRVLVVMSVDGVNVLTGETADYSQRGYVLRPYESSLVTGWRKTDAEVAAFTFSPLSRSYAARTGRPFDVGVIGVAAFRERYDPPPAAQASAPVYAPESGRSAAQDAEEMVVTGRRLAPAPAAPPPPPSARAAQGEVAASAQRRSERLGTGHGAREWSMVTTVAFQRATRHPQQVRRIEYDSYENLVALGVIRPGYPRRPRPFPGEGYVPDPPGGL